MLDGEHSGRRAMIFRTTACMFAGGLILAGCGGTPPQVEDPHRRIVQDVEASHIFQTTEDGIWDGQPSSGGVWVRHPEATGPQRVLIGNRRNGKLTIGSLLPRRAGPGAPRLRISQDAAALLDISKQAPTRLYVVALQSRQGLQPPRPNEDTTLLTPEDVAVDGVVARPTTPVAPVTPAAPIVPEPLAPLNKPYIQVGLFGVEANAATVAERLRGAGLPPVIRQRTRKGRTFRRVLAGPVQTRQERATLLQTIRALGFTDAYFVTE